jgi:hypothetical protein
MDRIVVYMKPETKKRMKAQAALKGKTMTEYILWSTGLVAVEKGNAK